MKKLFLIFIALATMVGLPSEAQTKKRTGTAKTASSTAGGVITKGKTYTYGDYLTTQEYSIKRGKNTIKVEYPISGNSALVASLKQYIKKSLAEKYTGSLESPDGILRAALRKIGRGETLTEEIKIIYTSDKVVTIMTEGDLDAGGAHGRPFETGETFFIDNGKSLRNYEYFPKFNSIRSSVLEGLAKYFDTSVSKLDEELIVSPRDIEEPSTCYMTKSGLTYVWAPYEIAPYMAGTPKSSVITTGIFLLMSNGHDYTERR